MAAYFAGKMKRKELEEVNDEFSDFSLSSPARKIRRLDADLPPIIEEEEVEIPPIFGEPMAQPNFGSSVGQTGGPVIEDLPSVPQNEERALVLFKPMNTPLLQSPSNYRVTVDSDLISGFKNHGLWSSESNPWTVEKETMKQNENSGGVNRCLAVVPWVPPQSPATAGLGVPEMDCPELMEAEREEAETMDIEEDNVRVMQRPMGEIDGISVNDGIHQWQQQQHCMIPQPPHNASTPIVWYR